MSASDLGSRMFYHGTSIEVQVGDRIRIKPWLFAWFRKARYGVICYIPGISPLHKHLEYEDVKHWAYRLDDGSIYGAGYYPEELPNGLLELGKHIEFISRGSGGELSPDEIVDETFENKEEEDDASA